jgi:phosphate transport system protein
MTRNRRAFDQDLEAIGSRVAELFAIVAEDLPAATQALLSGDQQAWRIVAERDQLIDARYAQIEELVARTILLQAPVGYDLQLLLSVLRVVPELENSHDLVTHIAACARKELHQDLSPRSRGLVERMGTMAGAMWRQSAVAWDQRDRTVVLLLGARDEELGELRASLLTELAAGQMTVPVTMEMTLVARFYRRLGNHAVNIARRMPYLAGPAPQEV